MKTTIPLGLSASLFLSIAPFAVAQENSSGSNIEEVIVTGQLSEFGASKSATPILETARSISIETAESFLDKGALTLGSTLEYTSGVDANTFGPSTRVDSVKIRGFDAAEYRDGQQIKFGYYNNTRTDVYMLEQVEVLKGPASVLYGKGTPGGLLNMVSKLAGPDKANEIVLDSGTHERQQIAADFNTKLAENIYFRTVGVYRDSGHPVDKVKDDALILMPSITYDNGQTKVTGLFEYSNRDSDTSSQFLPLTGTGCVDGNVTVTPIEICANANGQRIDSSTYHGEPGFNHFDTDSTMASLLASHVFNDNFSIDGIFRYKDGKSDYRQAWVDITLLRTGRPRVDSTGNATRTIYHSDASSQQAAADVRARYTFETGALDHELFLGAAYQDIKTDNRSLFLRGQDTINPYNPVYDGVPAIFNDATNLTSFSYQKAKDFGIYISDQISLGAWKFNVGLRYDEIETETNRTTNAQDDDATSFSAGVLYAFDSGLSPYISFAESFEPVIGQIGPPDALVTAKPKEGEQTEVGIKYQPNGTQTYITLAYFDIEESNLSVPGPNGGNVQSGKGTVSGFEVEAQTLIGDWSLEGNLSLIDTEDAKGLPFASIAENRASAWAQYRPSRGPLMNFKFGFGVRYIGERESNGAFASSAVLSGPVRVVTDETWLADLLIGYETDNWDLTLNARNLLDEEYYGMCLARGDCFPGEERSVVGRATYKF